MREYLKLSIPAERHKEPDSRSSKRSRRLLDEAARRIRVSCFEPRNKKNPVSSLADFKGKLESLELFFRCLTRERMYEGAHLP